MPTMHNLCTNGKNQNWPAHSRNIKLLHARSQVCWDGYDEQSKTFRLLVPQPIYMDTEHWKPREKLNLFFPLPGPKYTGEKETISKNIYISCTSAQWNKLEIGKKKKSVPFVPALFSRTAEHFYAKYIQKTDSIDCDKETSTMESFLPDFFQMEKKKRKNRTEGFQNRERKSVFFTGKYLQNSHPTSFIKLHIPAYVYKNSQMHTVKFFNLKLQYQ